MQWKYEVVFQIGLKDKDTPFISRSNKSQNKPIFWGFGMSIESTQHVPDTHVHKTLLRWAIILSPTHLLYVCFIYPIVKFLSLKSCIGTDRNLSTICRKLFQVSTVSLLLSWMSLCSYKCMNCSKDRACSIYPTCLLVVIVLTTQDKHGIVSVVPWYNPAVRRHSDVPFVVSFLGIPNLSLRVFMTLTNLIWTNVWRYSFVPAE